MLIVVFDGLPTWAPDVSETGESSFASIELHIPTVYNFARDYKMAAFFEAGPRHIGTSSFTRLRLRQPIIFSVVLN